MQSFASSLPTTPTPIPHPTKITHHILYHAPQKGRNYRLYLCPFYPKIHRKGATIAHASRKICEYLCKFVAKNNEHGQHESRRFFVESM